jgi:hypothetical protein
MYDLYCPVCGRDITPSNIDEFESGEHDGLIYVHDEIDHGDEDLTALEVGVQ